MTSQCLMRYLETCDGLIMSQVSHEKKNNNNVMYDDQLNSKMKKTKHK